MSRARMRAASALLSLGLALVSTAGALAQGKDEWEKVIAAARAEGKAVVYSGYTSATHDEIARAFERRYGIRVDVLQVRGTELRERIRTEQAAGRFLGDVLHNAQTSLEIMQAADKVVVAHGGLPNAANVRAAFKARATELWAPIFTLNYGILVNTGLVKPGEEPRSWQDLTDPRWKGKILSDEMRAAGGGRVMFHMTYDAFGADYHRKLAAQGIVFARDYRESTRRVARGEYPIYIPFQFSEFHYHKGLPVKYVIPAEGVIYGSYAVAVLRNAPRPNAARLLADFYLSDEAQTIYARSGHGIMVDKVSAALPPEFAALANLKPLAAEDFTKVQERLDQAIAIYK